MADLVPISDPDDVRLGDYRDLRDVQLRRSLEAAEGLFIAEGEKVIRRALAAGYRPRSFLLADRWLDSLADVLAGTDGVPCYVASVELLTKIAGFHVHRGALSSLRRGPLPSVIDVISAAHRIVVLEDLVDHTNVGAIFRCAAALGVDAVVLSPRCADPLYRRAVKVSMGAVFSLPYARMTDWHSGLTALRAAGFRLVALTPAEAAIDLDAAPLGGQVALLLGTEGTGLSSRWLDQADVQARIPMAHGVDSLNVVAATAIACYLLVRGEP